MVKTHNNPEHPGYDSFFEMYRMMLTILVPEAKTFACLGSEHEHSYDVDFVKARAIDEIIETLPTKRDKGFIFSALASCGWSSTGKVGSVLIDLPTRD